MVSDDGGNGGSQAVPDAVVKLTTKPRVRNMDNISLSAVAAVLDPESDLFLELSAIEALAKNQDLFIKVHRAMNNWVRVRLEGAAPSQDQLRQMITEASSDFAGEGYNPLKCWNERDSEKDVRRIVTAIANANIDLDLGAGGGVITAIRRVALADPLLEESLQRALPDQSTVPASLRLSVELCQANNIMLTSI